jgi:hypothetical protein
MINDKTIYIDNTSNGITIKDIVPLNLFISTSGVDTIGKLWKIEYDFGNGKSHTQILKSDNNTTENLKFLQEPSDPRNFIVNSYYGYEDDSNFQYDLKINFYTINSEIPQTINVRLELELPKYNTNDIPISGLNLVGMRMFGIDNKIIYIFESGELEPVLIPILMDFNTFKPLKPTPTPTPTFTPTPVPLATATPTPSTTVYAGAGQCGFSYNQGSGGIGLYYYTINLGTETGTVQLNYNAISVPDKFQVVWNDQIVIDTGWRGSSNYGLPVSGPGIGTATFVKNLSFPETATVIVDAPLQGTAWSFNLGCPS